MLINDMEDLRRNILELRGYYYSKAEEIYRKYPKEKDLPADKAWELGKAHGATEVLDALFLAAFGGKEMARVMEMSWEANQIARELEGEDEDP